MRVTPLEKWPCPFCGGKAVMTEYGMIDVVVTCLHCSAETLSIEDWTRRVTAASPDDE